jgi:hypothetical protein
MTALQFNVKDLFKSVHVAFSLQRLWLQFTGLIPGYLLYLVFTYTALMVAGGSFANIRDAQGLLPVLTGGAYPFGAVLLNGLGIFCLSYCYLFTATAVSRASYMNLKGNTFYTWKESFAFAARKKFSILLTPMVIAILIGFFILGGGFVGLVGRIPVVGEIGMSLFTVLWFVASLFMVFMGLALAISLCYTPSVLACMDDDAFEGIFQSFSTLFSQPCRFLFYKAVVMILALSAGAVFVLLAKIAWNVMILSLGWGMGEKFVNIAAAASYHVQSWTYPFVLCYQSVIGDLGSTLFYSHLFTPVQISGASAISAVIMAIFALVLGGYVMSFPFAVLNVGNTLSFLVIKKLKDDENLLERTDREEEEDEEEDKSGEESSDSDEKKGEEI